MIKLKRRDQVSHSSNWTKLANSYNWDPRAAKRALEKYGEYKGYFLATVEPIHLDRSIPCQELVTYLTMMPKIKQRSTFDPNGDSLQTVHVYLGDDDFLIKCEVTNRIVSDLVANDAMGFEHSVDSSEIEIDILKVTNQDGEVVVLDADTEELLLSKIEL